MPQSRQTAGQPAMTATVPRQLVHRAAVAETLLTGWRRLADDRFTVAAQWPRAHGLHVSADWTAYDPLLAVETVRQSGTLLSHTEYDVPLGHHFVLDAIEVTTHPEHLRVGALPAETEVNVTFTEVQYRGRRPSSARYTAEVLRCGARAATADVSFTCLGEAVYRRLRSGRTPDTVTAPPAPPGLPPEAVGRALPGDVVLAPRRPRGPLAAPGKYRTPRFSSTTPRTTSPACCCWRRPVRRPWPVPAANSSPSPTTPASIATLNWTNPRG
ncbi:hypothetical protein GCM10020256_14240 [Streptomyces thermocoprophilus]